MLARVKAIYDGFHHYIKKEIDFSRLVLDQN